MSHLLNTVANLVHVSKRLSRYGVPAFAVTEDGQETAHWTETKRTWEHLLERKLNPEEVAVLSLSRNYGPTPGVDEDEDALLRKRLWPRGNERGVAIQPSELAQRLASIPEALMAIACDPRTPAYMRKQLLLTELSS